MKSLNRATALAAMLSGTAACSLINPHVGVDKAERYKISAEMDACTQQGVGLQMANSAVAQRTAEYLNTASATSSAKTNRALLAASQLPTASMDAQIVKLEAATQSAKEAMEAAILARNAVIASQAKPSTGGSSKVSESAPTSPYCQFYGALPGAIEYGNTLREDYYDAVGDQSKLKNGLALTLIPISAAAVYLGITGGSTEAITGLAVAGASGLGIGSFMLSDARQTAYLSGSTTLGCAIVRSAPYLIRPQDFYTLQGAVDGLVIDRAKLTTDVSNLKMLLAQYAGESQLTPDTKAAAEAVISVADPLLVAAEGASSSGATAVSKIEGAGPALYGVVDDIRDKVSVEILKTEPDITAIAAIANGLSPATKGLINSFAPPAPASTKATGTDKDGGSVKTESIMLTPTGDQQVAAATAEVNAALLPVQQRVFQIQPFVSRMHDMETQLGALTDCPFKKLDNAGFSIDPATPDIAMIVGATYTLQATGAIGNITAQVIGNGDPAGLSSETTGSGSGLRVTITAKKVGSYQVSLADASGKNSKVLNVTVTAPKMAIAPADREITMKLSDATKTKVLTVTGVDSITFPSFTGTAGGLKVDVTPSATKQTVTITAQTPGSYVLTIADGTKQQTVDIKITVAN